MAEKMVPGGFDGPGGFMPPEPPGADTLALAYADGSAAADQTLTLLDVKGGGVALNATTPGQAFVTAFEIDVIGGSMNFYHKGGFDVASTFSVAAALGANWDQVNFLASTIALTGGPTTVASLTMVHIGRGIINGNTVSDAYNFLVDSGPIGTAIITRDWSAGFNGAVQMGSGLVLGASLLPPTENDLVFGVGATVVSEANSGRLGYRAGASQQFYVSLNTGAYVPLLIGPAAGGFTSGSVPFADAAGQLTQNNANFFWNATNATLQLGGSAVGAASTLRLLANKSVVAAADSVWDGVSFSASTLTLTGATTPVTAIRFFNIAKPTITAASAVVTATAATVYIAGAPGVAASATISRPLALWVDGSGATRIGAAIVMRDIGGDLTFTNIGFSFDFSTLRGATGIWQLGTNAGGAVVVGSNSAPATASTKLQVVATLSVVAAAGAVWDAAIFAASTLTLTGATTPITTLNFVNIVAPTITAASAVVTTDFFTCRIGAATFAGVGPASATRNWSLGLDGNVRVLGNIVMGTGISAGANAVKTIALCNDATAPAASVNLAHLYAADIAAGRATLAIYAEEAVAADVALASTHSFIVFIDGVKYKLMLVAA
jgi:hypothetical protein